MPTLYRDTGYSLIHLIADIRVGRLALPDIQRPFVWSSAKTRDLFDSMYRGYPIGTLMFWETGADVGVRQIGTAENEKVPQLLIVDGQQRLTSLYAVLTGHKVLTKTFENKRIRIAFRPEDEAFEVTDVAIERDPEFIADITSLWADGYKTTVRNFLQRLGESRDEAVADAHGDLLEERIDRVRDLRDFRFQVVELGVAANEEQVAEIFVRINSEGVKLNQADFILTLMSVHWEKGRRQLEEFSRGAVDPTVTGVSPKNPFVDPSPDQLLRVGIGLASGGPGCSTSITSSEVRTSTPGRCQRRFAPNSSDASPKLRRRCSTSGTGMSFSSACTSPGSAAAARSRRRMPCCSATHSGSSAGTTSAWTASLCGP